uniref:EF-hand domain-containing protein n=1 Tax=Leersia perrieri TaxID=77586 RepID=A0A0D9XTV4_9ORYZ
MEKSPATAGCLFELEFQEPVCLIILTMFTWFISKLQIILPNSCQHFDSPATKAASATVLVDREIPKTLKKHKDDGIEMTHEDVDSVMRKMGLDFDQQITMDYKSIGLNCMSELFGDDEPSLHEVKQAFLVFDEDNDGYIDAFDLYRVLKNLGLREGVEVDECDQMIARYDRNEDRRIDMVEFIRVLEASFC